MPRRKQDLRIKTNASPRPDEWHGKNVVRFLAVAHEAAREGDYATAEKWTNMALEEMGKLKNQRSESVESQTSPTVAAIIASESTLKEKKKKKPSPK